MGPPSRKDDGARLAFGAHDEEVAGLHEVAEGLLMLDGDARPVADPDVAKGVHEEGGHLVGDLGKGAAGPPAPVIPAALDPLAQAIEVMLLQDGVLPVDPGEEPFPGGVEGGGERVQVVALHLVEGDGVAEAGEVVEAGQGLVDLLEEVDLEVVDGIGFIELASDDGDIPIGVDQHAGGTVDRDGGAKGEEESAGAKVRLFAGIEGDVAVDDLEEGDAVVAIAAVETADGVVFIGQKIAALAAADLLLRFDHGEAKGVDPLDDCLQRGQVAGDVEGEILLFGLAFHHGRILLSPKIPAPCGWRNSGTDQPAGRGGWTSGADGACYGKRPYISYVREAKMARPNILLLFTDQQRHDTIHALGNPVIRTPNLDRLATEGVAFTNAFTPSPVCVAARCSMIHGQYPLHTGCKENTPMPQDRESFMDGLVRAGYRTHGIGKCHFSPDLHALRGFQSRESSEEMVSDPSRDDYMTFLRANGFAHICDPHGIRGEMYYVPQPAQMPQHLHPTHWVGDRSTAFLREQASSGEPWFLFSSFIHPHPPFAPPNPWHKLYRAPLMPLPNVPADHESLLTYINRRQNRYKYRDQGIDQNLLRNQKAYYYASISFVDYQIGRILKVLEESGQLENTLIVHSSDHGEHLGDYHCFGKRSMHDSAARIPLLARLPGTFDGGRRCDRPVSLVDLAPTFLEVAEATISSHPLDGASLIDLCNSSVEREMVFGQHDVAGAAQYMAVTRDWKYIYSAPDNREFLFDKQQDPLETRNRAGLAFLREVRDGMRKRLIAHLKEGGESEALDGDEWRIYPRLEVSEDPDTGLLIQDHAWADTRLPGYTD